ncbi:MAG: septation regulator SpoVG [Oscillospiraceae bacterium]
MNITDIRIRKTYSDNRLRALVSITVDNDLAVHDIKIIEGPSRLFVAMPSRKDEAGTFRDIVHPITPEARSVIEDSILNAYDEYLAQHSVEEDRLIQNNNSEPLQ